ncbi:MULTISPECIES: ABC transporter permease [Mycobacteriaceae]|uniref:ABC transporter permease subunit n=1 Tax=Mycolicibacterium parafortuitum TaxID=39692 RepID=A0ACC6MKB2_MYCPF|nr:MULTISPECIES: ABC transporter permease subunit [Mycobacteriaceae]MDZ5087401.1 ABC transporter permease subunit [Mycolicibacterium parafortuitum]
MTSTLTRRSSATTPTPQPRRRWRPPPEITAVATGLLVWWLCAGNVLPYLPSPASVVTEMTAAMSSPTLYESMAITLRRIVIAWGTGFLIALAVGVAMARNRYAEALAHPVVFIGLALPGPVTILFSTLWLGLGELATLVALTLAVTPFMVTFVYDGSRALDPGLFQMASVYRMGAVDRFRQVILPQLAPALLSAARFGFAMGWKLVVLVEALSAGSGIGERIEYFFSYNRPAAVIAWTLSFTVVMVLVEVLVFRTVSRRVFRWRPTAGGDR